MKDHPWEDRSPNDVEELEMASCIGKSTVYTLTAKWCIWRKCIPIFRIL